MKNITFTLLLFCACLRLHAQTNVIGATEKRISEKDAGDQSLFIEANQKFLLEDYSKAQEIIEKFVYNQDKNDGAFFLLARIYTAQKDYQNALVAAKRAAALDPQNKWYQHLEADIYEATGRTKDAIQVYSNLLKTWPKAPLYYEKLSYLHTLDGAPQQALKVLDAYQGALGMSEEIADRRHLLYLGLQDDKSAIKAFEDLVRAFPRETAYLHKIAKYYRTTSRPQEAAKVYQRILAINPDDPDARIGAVMRQDAASSQDFLQSLQPLLADPTISIDSKIGKLMPYLQQMETESDSTKRALMQNAAAELTKIHPNEAKAWSFAGDVHYLLDQNATALGFYTKCISLQPSVFSVWQNTFEILYSSGNYKDLLTVAEKGMDAFPNQALSYYYYGVAANHFQKPQDALTQLQQGLLMSGNQTAIKLDISSEVARAHLLQKNTDKAIEILEATLPKGGAKHPNVLETLGDAYQAKGNTAKAQESWKSAEKIQTSERLRKKIG